MVTLYFYAKTRNQANKLTTVLAAGERVRVIDPNSNCQIWSIRVDTDMDPANINKEEMTALAKECEVEYDGYGVIMEVELGANG